MADKNYRIPLFCVVTSIYWFSLYAYVPTLSPYVESLGASYKMIGLIIGSYGFTQMLLRIPLGILSDKINQRKIFIVIGVLLGLISATGLWIFDQIIMVLIFRSLAGAAAACWVTYTVLFSSYFKSEESPRAIGIINAFTKTGQVTAMFLGGLAAQYYGQQAPFLVAAIGGIIGLALSSGTVEKKAVNHKPIKIKQLFKVAKNYNLMMVSLLAVLFQLIVFATIFGFVPVAAKNIGASSFQLGLLTTLSTVPAIFSSFLSGSFFARRYGEKNTIIAGFIIIAFSCIVVPYINNVSVLFLSQIIGGIGRGLVYPILMGLSIKGIAENRRATAMGFFQSIYGLGMFLGPVVVGILSDIGGLNIGFWFTGLIGFMSAILTFYLLKNTAVPEQRSTKEISS